MQDRDHVLSQINKLMAIAGDEAASDNEVEMAFERAQKLIRRHAIQEWELEKEGKRDAEPVEDLTVALHYGKFNRVACVLASTIGAMNSIKVILDQTRHMRDGEYKMVNGEVKYVRGRSVAYDTGMRLIGRKTDMDRVLAVWTSLELFRASHYRKRWERENVWNQTAYEFRKSYYLGFNQAIAMRAAQLKATDDGGNSKEMVIAKDAAIDEYVRENIGALQNARSRRSRVYRPAFESGLSDGARADIGGKRVGASRSLIES